MYLPLELSQRGQVQSQAVTSTIEYRAYNVISCRLPQAVMDEKHFLNTKT